MPRNDPPRTLADWLGLARPPDWTKAPWLGGLAGFLLGLVALAWLVLFVMTIGAALRGVSGMTGTAAGATGGVGGNLGLGAVLVALLGAPFLIWNTVIRQRTLGFQKEGHITDRISKAVEQLGAEKTVKVPKDDGTGSVERTVPNIEVRIGGILSLERIAQDSCTYDNGRDHVRVMEILCAYVRENAPAREAKDHPYGDWEPLKDGATEAEKAAHLVKREERFGANPWDDKQVANWALGLPPPREDIAQALKVIGRRNAGQRRIEARWGKDAAADAEWVFDRTCPSLPDRTDDTPLLEAELAAFRGELSQWKRGIDAYAGYRPDLRNTNLQRADLSDAVLGGALLQGARMQGADLDQTRLERANLLWARMEGADLWDARLEGADLEKALLDGANLELVRMAGANLREARMERAYLGRAQMEGANLWHARMEGADLREVRMDALTRLEGAILTGARMRAVDLRGVRITQAQIEAVFSDGSVAGKLPEGLTWPARWPTWVLPDRGKNGFEAQAAKWRDDPAGYRPPPAPADQGA